jgi:hypothetical protein
LEWITSVQSLLGVHQTHYGPAGHAPLAGRALEYGIHAEITEDVPDDVKCGYFHSALRPFPDKGPLRRSAVSWTDTGGLQLHGQTKSDKLTDSNGNALFTFDPKNERLPGFGPSSSGRGSSVRR